MKSLVLTVLLISILGTSHTKAESFHPAFSDKWQFTVGAYYQDIDAKFRATASGDAKIDINLGDLGLDDNATVPQLGARFQFSDKWALNLGISDFDLSGSRGLTRSFNYDGVTYPLNTALKTDLGMTVYVVAFDYALSQSEKTDWGVGAGLHAIKLTTRLKGTLNNLSLTTSGQDFLAPLPNIRFFARHAFSPRLLGQVNIGLMGATIDKYSGSLALATVSLDYRLADNWSAGLSYQLTDMRLDIDGRTEQDYDITLQGFGLSLQYAIR